MALLSYYFHHASSGFDAFAHKKNSNANPQSWEESEHWMWMAEEYTLLCSLSIYLVQLIQYSSSPFGPFISSWNGIFGDGDGDGLPLANQNHMIFLLFLLIVPLQGGEVVYLFWKPTMNFHFISVQTLKKLELRCMKMCTTCFLQKDILWTYTY